ncbi:hypothetical protein VA7868_03582 [Vibrio aerogenes CECT 7868]|uniref:Uncharacterized protein n=1 Tax=Vibrio aerogenes CECT 7868 TaxID=1216006 RepID=A0A1M6AI31_9VIBR|nr:hypothetical protein [Vibrio aerogenes]SHI36097.1 hypothetical protein VA7868_03582 [Vibrio aerogenes CECT 7868]
MPVTIAYDPALSQQACEYLMQIEDYLHKNNPSDHNFHEVILYMNKLITIQDVIGKTTASGKASVKQ